MGLLFYLLYRKALYGLRKPMVSSRGSVFQMQIPSDKSFSVFIGHTPVDAQRIFEVSEERFQAIS